MRRHLVQLFSALCLSTAILAAGLPSRVVGQSAIAPENVKKTAPVVRSKPAKKPPRDKYGTPLDTLMSTRLTTTAPPAEDFVRATHPAAEDLHYTPLTGVDPERPKPRDKANIMALQAELERDGATARGKAVGIGGTPTRITKRKPKPQ